MIDDIILTLVILAIGLEGRCRVGYKRNQMLEGIKNRAELKEIASAKTIDAVVIEITTV